MTFRFDDICINSNAENDWAVTEALFTAFPHADIIWCVSPLVHNNCGERVYPKIMNAMSDRKKHYHVDRSGIPEIHPQVKLAGHGLVHEDHRLFSKELQEASILISCSLIGAKIFTPPFNKWTPEMEIICEENDIELIVFEEGWLCMEHNEFDKSHDKWYLHAREWTPEKIKEWIGAVQE